MIRKTLIALVVLVVLAGSAGAGAVWYVRPAEELDLKYAPISVQQKVLDMIKNRKLEVRLSEAELNDLLKWRLAEHRSPRPDVWIEGASFRQRGNRLSARVNLKYADTIRVGAILDFELIWQNSELIVRHVGTHLRGLSLPVSWLQLDPVVVPLRFADIPFVEVKRLDFLPEGGVRIGIGLQEP